MRLISWGLKLSGGLVIALGALWVLQGTGLLDWPPGSVMLGAGVWSAYGAGAIVCGAALVWLGARLGR